jgi:hypothetical protein
MLNLDRDNVYFNLPPGPSIPRYIWHATSALLHYMEPQTNRQGFVASSKDPVCLQRRRNSQVHLVCYVCNNVDDIAFAGNNPDAIAKFKAELSAEFKMSDLGCEVIQDLNTTTETKFSSSPRLLCV